MATRSEDLDALRAHYGATDTSADLERAELDTTTVDEPMVGITLRLPAATLNAARAIARERGIKVTALMREWVEAGMADAAADDAVVSVRELRHALASAQTVQQWAALRTGGAAAGEVGTQRVAQRR